MSKTLRPDDHSESPEAVKKLFQRLADGTAECFEGPVIWGILVSDPWFRAKVSRRAQHFVRSHGLPDHLSEDIGQEVLLVLAAKLAADPTLHANAALLPDKFLAWLDAILDHACSNAARLLGQLRPPYDESRKTEVTTDEFAVIDQVSDCSAAVAKLEGMQRSVMLLFLKGRERAEIADTLHMTYKQVVGTIARAGPRLRRWLAAYREEKG